MIACEYRLYVLTGDSEVSQLSSPLKCLMARYLFTSLRDLWIQPPEDIAGQTESFRLP